MRLLIVSNRLPVTGEFKDGQIVFKPSAGGLATGLKSFLERAGNDALIEYLWIGWPGIQVDVWMQEEVKQQLVKQYRCYPVFYSEETYSAFYVTFCNGTLWPIFHSMSDQAVFNEASWEQYKLVNAHYADVITQLLRQGDVIWIHDVHLMVLPSLLRKKFQNASIGFFLHIPFPSYEIFRILSDQWKRTLLNGLLGADLIGFHTVDYCYDFLKCVEKILGINNVDGKLLLNGRVIKVDTFPMGIDFRAFRKSAECHDVSIKRNELHEYFGGRKLILSIDRLDYTKGVINRLLAYEQFLIENPEWINRVTMILILVPSREQVPAYRKMKEQIDELVGKINGSLSSDSWLPISYQYKQKNFIELVALYSGVDVALVTPLRDGMNLIAKEFVASRQKLTGVLVLSEMAGSSRELLDAKVVNPFHTRELTCVIQESLTMSVEEQERRMTGMQQRVQEYDVFDWVEDILCSLNNTVEQTKQLQDKLFLPDFWITFKEQFSKASTRLIVLDYDGTLVPFEKYPHMAAPSPRLLDLLRSLALLNETEIVICTGRNRQVLDQWFSGINISFIAENGCWVKLRNNDWKLTSTVSVSSDWKSSLFPILNNYSYKLPGSFIEEKEFSLVWHFRNSEPQLAESRLKDFIRDTKKYIKRLGLEVTSEVKSLEIKCKGVSKERSLLNVVDVKRLDFIACFGDDYRDEGLFKKMPRSSYTFKIGNGSTSARYRLTDSSSVFQLLSTLTSSHPLSDSCSNRSSYSAV